MVFVILVGGLYVAFVYYDLLRQVPGFYCESFGCFGLGLAYTVIGTVIIPLTMGAIGYLTAKKRKVMAAADLLVLSFLVMLVATYIVEKLNDARIAEDTTKVEALTVEYTTPNEEKVILNNETPLAVPTDPTRNESGRGVFQAKIVPDEIFVNNPTVVTVSAEIGSTKDIETVMLYSLSDSLTKPVPMYDTGKNGDLRANDTVYTTKEELTVTSPREITYEIKVTYKDGYEATSDQNLKLHAYKRLSKEELANVEQVPIDQSVN